jgi:hypothetical protein
MSTNAPFHRRDHDAELRAAFAPVAEAYERALTILPVDHPEVTTLRQLCRDARECAGLAHLELLADSPE